MSRIQIIISLFSILLFSQCSLKKVSSGAESKLQIPESYSTTVENDTTHFDAITYSDFFKDTVLVNLIDTALSRNIDLKIAMQRIEQASANFLSRRSALAPQFNIEGNVGVAKFGNNTAEGAGNFNVFGEDGRQVPYPQLPMFSVGIRSSWELDIWKKLRKMKEGDYYRFLASRKAKDMVLTMLVSNIAHQYYFLLEKDNELQIIRRNIQLQEKAVDLIKIQKIAGRVTELAVKQFQAQLLNSQSLEYQALQEIIEIENNINLLLGRMPQKIKRGSPLLEQELPEMINKGVPSDLLKNRPDIQQQELLLMGSKADIYVARASFYPSITLSGFLGVAAYEPQLLAKVPEALAYDVMSGLIAPVFNRRVLKANEKRVKAENVELLYNYEQTILTAFNEVVTDMKRIDYSEEVYKLKDQQVKELQRAVSTSNDLFLGGYATYLEVVTAQKNVFEAELELTVSRRNQFSYIIDLYRALGGGWR